MAQKIEERLTKERDTALAEVDKLRIALREACDLATAAVCVGPTRSEEERIAELRALAER